jgi:hypothetical protein
LVCLWLIMLLGIPHLVRLWLSLLTMVEKECFGSSELLGLFLLHACCLSLLFLTRRLLSSIVARSWLNQNLSGQREGSWHG